VDRDAEETSRVKTRRIVCLIGLALAACGSEPDPPVDPEFGPLTIGGGLEDGSSGFVELTNGQDVTLVPGAQGGFHVYLNVRVEEKSMGDQMALYIDRKARRVDTDQLVSQARQLAPFEPSAEAGYFDTARPMLMFLCPAPAGIQVFDKTLIVKALGLLHHMDAEPIAEGTVTITPRCPEGGQRAFCEDICSGN
jgi:hypothetical protein